MSVSVSYFSSLFVLYCPTKQKRSFSYLASGKGGCRVWGHFQTWIQSSSEDSLLSRIITEHKDVYMEIKKETRRKSNLIKTTDVYVVDEVKLLPAE